MAIEQKDIDRLLLCRAVIDKHRAFNTARAESLVTAKSVYGAKALIEAKIGVATTISADSAVKPVADIKNVLEPERTKYTLEMYEILRQQGFETFQAFTDFNAILNFEAFKESCPVIGECDFCGEKGIAKQNCVLLYGITNCAINAKELNSIEGVYKESFKRLNEGVLEEIDGVICTVSVCPKGHGFYNDVKNFKTPPFDILWRT